MGGELRSEAPEHGLVDYTSTSASILFLAFLGWRTFRHIFSTAEVSINRFQDEFLSKVYILFEWSIVGTCDGDVEVE